MLRGERVGLRARRESDLPILLAELYDDVPTRSRADTRPWVPVTDSTKRHPYDVDDAGPDVAPFSVVDLQSDDLAGEALLWAVDTYNRSAHLGLSIRPGLRGQGLGTDVVRVLCHYGFVVRGLHRLQVDTLADNESMIRAALAVGFSREATLREAAWVMGQRVDEVVLGLLATEYRPNGPGPA